MFEVGFAVTIALANTHMQDVFPTDLKCGRAVVCEEVSPGYSWLRPPVNQQDFDNIANTLDWPALFQFFGGGFAMHYDGLGLPAVAHDAQHHKNKENVQPSSAS